MADQIKVTTRFARKGKVEQAGDYEMVEAEAVIEQVFDGDVDPAALTEVIEDQFITIKSQVFSQLGLSFMQDEDSAMIFETFEGAETVAAPKKRKLAPVPDPDEDEEDEEEEMEEEEPPPPPKKKATKVPAKKVAKKVVEEEDDEEDIEPQNEREEMFLELMRNPKKWKLANGKSANSPRWQHTTKKRAGTNYPVGLWEKDAPDWFEDPYS